MDYILFIMESNSFQSRSLLVPKDLFLKVPKRAQEYEILKRNAKTYVFKNKDRCDMVNNVLFVNYSPFGEKKEGRYWAWQQDDNKEYSNVLSDMHFYADWSSAFLDDLGDHPLKDLEDIEWVRHMHKDFCGGFNHILNYLTCKEMKLIGETPINIVDSFLVLETYEGKFKFPQYDTVDEMFENCYGYKLSDVKNNPIDHDS